MNGGNTRRFDSRNEKFNVGGFVRGDEFEVEEEFLVKADVDEILKLEAGESFLIEGVLEVLQLSHSQMSCSMLYEAPNVNAGGYSRSARTVEW